MRVRRSERLPGAFTQQRQRRPIRRDLLDHHVVGDHESLQPLANYLSRRKITSHPKLIRRTTPKHETVGHDLAFHVQPKPINRRVRRDGRAGRW